MSSATPVERATPLSEWEMRNVVGRWLRIRAEHIADSVGIAGHAPRLNNSMQHGILTQLAADAEHSSLLARLFRGEEPLPFDEWKDSDA